MTVAGIYKAWVVLLVLSCATTGLTLIDAPFGLGSAGVLLALSGLKARTILARYLELHRSAFWMKLFDLVIGLFLLIAFVLYAAGSGRTS
ncbi:MAG: hypothetical protein ABL907_16940 [Hyphomicrobium sp.]